MPSVDQKPNFSIELQVPYRPWVPMWMQVVVALCILVPTLMINGAYNGSSIDISGFFGALSEDINFAFFASSAGMAIAYPVTRTIKMFATPKTIILSSLALQVLLSIACINAKHIETIAMLSFLIGFLKAFTLREIMIILMPVFGGANGKLSRFYSLYYPITLTLSQVSMVVTAELAYRFQWQYMYYLMVAMLLFAIVVVLVCLRYARRPVMVAFREIDWASIVFGSLFFLSLMYVLTYGKVDDWFDSPKIWAGMAITASMFVLFVRRQLVSDDPYLDLGVFRYRVTSFSYWLMLVMMLFAQTNTLVSAYTTTVLRLDSIHSNMLYFWSVPGFVVGALLAYWWYEKGFRVMRLVVIGFCCFLLSDASLYFIVHSQGTYEALYPAMIFKGVGLLILFVGFGVRATAPLPNNKKLSNAFFMIGIRSTLVPVIGSCLFANWLYRLQVRNIMILSGGIDMQNPLVAERFTRAMKAATAQGMGYSDARMMALNNIYQTVQAQATLVSIKEILGYCLIGGIILVVFVALRPLVWPEKPEVSSGVGSDMV